MLGRSTTEAIYLIRRLLELHRGRKKDLYIMFIDLKKAYDKVSCEVLWECLEKKKLSKTYISAIKNMYEVVKTSVRILGGDIEDFPIDLGLHQGLALRLLLFTVSMDILTKGIQDEVP